MPLYVPGNRFPYDKPRAHGEQPVKKIVVEGPVVLAVALRSVRE
jgi:hypothetical protein